MSLRLTESGYVQSDCGKNAFTKKEAVTALHAAQKRRHNNQRDKLRVYACNICGWWHLTSKFNLYSDEK